MQMATVSATELEMHLRVLTESIGVRLAGTSGERRAADYVAEQAARLGARVTVETFPVRARDVRREQVEIRVGGRWERFPCSLFSSTPGTGGQPIEAPLCFFEAPAEYRRPDLSHLAGKAVVHLGTHIESREHYRRLMEARPAVLLFVDIRYPGAVPLADGMFPSYTRALGAVPTVNVAFQDAWRWKAEGADAARVTVDGGMREGSSQNVVLELPGSDSDEWIVVGGHHDTQAGSAGADDNGSGVAAVLELTRVLAARPHRRGFRLISFGAEEQLSVGSAEYVRRHRAEMADRVRFMLNCDSYGSLLGWTQLIVNGPPDLPAWLVERFVRAGLWTVPTSEVTPYADHFPFVAAGVPSMLLYRTNCVGGRFFHHRPDDDITRLSLPLMARLLDCCADLLEELANAPAMPFGATIAPEQQEQVRRYWEDLFGGWAAR
jgi:hypothetical protein